MRRIVVEWMLDVCIDQRCHVDVFLLATNIMDRFLSTIRKVEEYGRNAMSSLGYVDLGCVMHEATHSVLHQM